jgi:hypothetical protein
MEIMISNFANYGKHYAGGVFEFMYIRCFVIRKGLHLKRLVQMRLGVLQIMENTMLAGILRDLQR